MKTINRTHAIDEIIESRISTLMADNFSLPSILEHGCTGLDNYSNSQLEEEYYNEFQEEIKISDPEDLQMKYKDNPDYCPFCGSDRIQADHADFSGINGFRPVWCHACKKEWTEEFTLTRITENEEE